jgi:hypothetical protein
MDRAERRKFKRLPITLDLSCRKVVLAAEQLHTGCTVNVSSGGLYFMTANDVFEPGSLLKVELSVPPTTGLLEFGGRISGFGRVLRTCRLCGSHANTNSYSERYGVAVEFCRSPKLCM